MGGYVVCRIYCLDGLLGSRVKPGLLLVLSLFFFGVHQWALATGYSHPWADSYLDTLLFLPITMGIPAWAIRRIEPSFKWQWPFILGAWILSAILFEYYIPAFDTRFTADIWDVLAYALGGTLLYFSEKSWS